MNISNDVLFKGVAAFVDAISDAIADEVTTRMNSRIEQLEVKVQNTLDNTKPILENFQERISKIETQPVDLYDMDALVDKVVDRVVDSDGFRENVESIVERELEDYDPADHMEIGDAIDDYLSYNSGLERAVKDAVRNLEFTVEVN